MRGLMMDRPLLISSLLEHAAEVFAAVAIVTRTVEGPIHRYTWTAARHRSKQVAQALRGPRAPGRRRRGAPSPGTPIGTSSSTTACPAWAPSCTRSIRGCTRPSSSTSLNHAQDRALFVDLTFVPLVEAVWDKLESVRHLVVMTDRAHMPDARSPGALCYEDLLAAQDGGYDWPTFDENTAAGICYTSGTTGNPKGVVYSHRSSVLHAYGVALPGGIPAGPGEALLPVVPMFHVNAWGIPYGAAMCGYKLVMPGPRLDGAGLTELMNAERVTTYCGVPTVHLGLLAHWKASGESVPSLKTVTTGGAAPTSGMIAEFSSRGIGVVHGWGMTETSPVGTVGRITAAEEGLDDAAQVAFLMRQGRKLFGVELRVVDSERPALPRDGRSVGRAADPGPLGLLGLPGRGAGQRPRRRGLVPTGDVAVLHPDGTLQITDRKKDLIKSGGEWISSIDLENAAARHPEIALAAVIGIPHEKWGERPLLIAQPGARRLAHEGVGAGVPGGPGREALAARRRGLRGRSPARGHRQGAEDPTPGAVRPLAPGGRDRVSMHSHAPATRRLAAPPRFGPCRRPDRCSAQGEAGRQPGRRVQLRWQLKEDVFSGRARARRARPSRSPTGHAAASRRGWALYFNALHEPRRGQRRRRVQARARDGRPAAARARRRLRGLAPGQSVEIEYLTSLLTNHSFAPVGALRRLRRRARTSGTRRDYVAAPFERAAQGEGRDPRVVTPEQQYALDSVIRDIPLAELPPVFPTPLRARAARRASCASPRCPRSRPPAELRAEAAFAADVSAPLLRQGRPRRRGAASCGSRRAGSRGRLARSLRAGGGPARASASSAPRPPASSTACSRCAACCPLPRPAKGLVLTALSVVDAPRFGYRGFMLDVARNFQPKASVLRTLDLLARYKLNTLPLPPDRGRGLAARDPEPARAHDGRRAARAHARLEPLPAAGLGLGPRRRPAVRQRLLLAGRLRRDPALRGRAPHRGDPRAGDAGPRAGGDQGDGGPLPRAHAGGRRRGRAPLPAERPRGPLEYTSAQLYHDNVMNPALDSTYAFVERVVADLVALHREAGVPLRNLHMGGDEVPTASGSGRPPRRPT